MDDVLRILMGSVEYAEQKEDAAEKDYTLSLTLHIGGMLVSGDLISEHQYLREFMDGAVLRKMENLASEIAAAGDSEPAEAQEASNEREYIHMRDAKFYHPGKTPVPGAGDGVLWRGRVASVDSFILGTLAVTVGRPS